MDLRAADDSELRFAGYVEGVCTENLNPDIMVMKASKDRA